MHQKNNEKIGHYTPKNSKNFQTYRVRQKKQHASNKNSLGPPVSQIFSLGNQANFLLEARGIYFPTPCIFLNSHKFSSTLNIKHFQSNLGNPRKTELDCIHFNKKRG
jgi:hypothetical protein